MNATTAKPASAPFTEDALRSVLVAGERPSRPGPVLTSLTFGWRALLKIKHVPEQLVDVDAAERTRPSRPAGRACWSPRSTAARAWARSTRCW